jgi:hypothetical protein
MSRARGATLGTAVTAAAACTGILVAYAALPVLFDADSYYHVAVGRLYHERGLVDGLAWARMSVLHGAFGDKELLFHLLLVPGAALGHPEGGAAVVMALLGAGIAGVLAAEGFRCLGGWGWVVPVLVLAGSSDFALRLLRVRPEMLALLLLLLALRAAARAQGVRLALVAALFALGYTAWHALLAVIVLLALWERWSARRSAWALVGWTAIGVAVGLVVHPGFADNLRVWAVQNLDFFLRNPTADFGPEIGARTTRDVLALNAVWALGVATLAGSGSGRVARREREFVTIAALAFGLLYLVMARFVTYAVPLATLAALAWHAGDRRGATVELPGGRGIPFALAMAGCLALVPAQLATTAARVAQARAMQPGVRADWEAMGRALPDGARVFAPWSATESLVFWAPQAAYLNVLDPLFMRAADPARYRTYVEVVEGREPDVPLVARAEFDSEFYADDGQYPGPRRRLRGDPRAVALHDGLGFAFRMAPQEESFWTDWQVRTGDGAAAVPYPRADDPVARRLEGYVDGRRLGRTADCVVFTRVEEVSEAVDLWLELAPYGPAELALDGRPVGVVRDARWAILGEGLVVSLALTPGRHEVAVRTCRAGEQLGFYAVVRGRAVRSGPGP